MSHTPGPWHTDKEYPIYIWGPNKEMVADLPDAGEESYLARMRGVVGGATEQEQEDNACLMAAAPDLLEALKILYEETADYIRINNLGDVHHNCSMQMARAAIAKAEGRSS